MSAGQTLLLTGPLVFSKLLDGPFMFTSTVNLSEILSEDPLR